LNVTKLVYLIRRLPKAQHKEKVGTEHEEHDEDEAFKNNIEPLHT